MKNLKNYDDWKKSLEESGITDDDDFLWWRGAIDACYLSGIFSVDERHKMFKVLDKINDKRG